MTKKKEPSLLRLVVVLTAIALVAGLALTGVYALTKEPIDQEQARKKQEALNQVLPDFKGTFKDTVVTVDGESMTLHLAILENGNLYGAGVETFTKKAFGGRFDLMVGLDTTGTIINTEVLSAAETPGLGDNINKDKSDFALQFNNHNPESFHLWVKKDKIDGVAGDVDAITAATISSRAYCDAVQRAYDVFMKVKEAYNE